MTPRLESAVSRSRKALELPSDVPFDDISLSVYLKYLLVAKLENEYVSVSRFRSLPPEDREIAFEEIAAAAANLVRSLVAEAAATLRDDSRFRLSTRLLETIPEREIYTGRIAQLAIEQFTSERLAPELCIAPVPLSLDGLAAALPGSCHFVILFDAFTNFANELYPLIVDALESDSETRGKPGINVLGVQTKWWNDGGGIQRAIFLRASDHILIESEMDEPQRPDVVLFLCMDREKHHTLSRKAESLRVKQINPHEPASRIADDKFDCFQRWSAAGVPTPPAILLPRSMPEAEGTPLLTERIREWEKDGVGVVIQPNHGTEGRGAAWFPPGTPGEQIMDCARRVGRGDDVLARKEVRGLFFLPEEGGEPVACDLRINVTWDGKAWQAESGYLQVAGEESNPITSAGRGGRIVKFSRDPLDRLVVREAGGFHLVRLTDKDHEHIRDVSIEAARSVGQTGLIGIDLRLVTVSGTKAGSIEAFALDANPRPAGLAHSEFLPAAGRPREPGVSRRLWNLVRSD